MQIPVTDHLVEALDAVRGHDDGATADYIPELADADPALLGVAIATLDGEVYAAGDAEARFTIQSISKPFVYGLALDACGFDAVLGAIGVEPSGEAFNEISLEEGSKRPLNPMINAGAITCHALLGDTEQASFAAVLDGLGALAGRRLTVDEAVYTSEFDTAHRNLAIAHMLRSYDVLTLDPESVVRGYTRQCAVEVDVRDLAVMVATLANGGVQPVTGERALSPRAVRQVLSVMTTCGMYDATGDWVTTVGIPAKSGVSGGIVGGLPGEVGLSTFSPRLDERGNSVRGLLLFEKLSRDLGLHLFEAADSARSVIAGIGTRETDDGPARLFSVQGNLHFAAAERVVRALARDESGLPVVIDLDEVFTINAAARRMLAEAAQRLGAEGRRVTFADPDGLLADR